MTGADSALAGVDAGGCEVAGVDAADDPVGAAVSPGRLNDAAGEVDVSDGEVEVRPMPWLVCEHAVSAPIASTPLATTAHGFAEDPRTGTRLRDVDMEDLTDVGGMSACFAALICHRSM